MTSAAFDPDLPVSPARLLVGLMALVALILLGVAWDRLGAPTMRLFRPFIAMAAAFALTACATPGGLEGRADNPAALEAYKEFSRACDRQYGWPLTAAISCRAQRSLDDAQAQAAVIAEAVKQGVAAGVAEALKAAGVKSGAESP